VSSLTRTEISLVHFMDALSIWGREFASALSSLVPTIGWVPRLSWTGALQRWERSCDIEHPPLRARSFPLQRGFRRGPIGWLARTATRQHEHLLAASADHRSSVLILTSPYYAPLAALWKGPLVYYVTDLLTNYAGFHEPQIRRLDKRMCQAAWLVCPNSTRIAAYLNEQTQCPAAKIVVVPNATRKQNLLSSVPSGPAVLPTDISDLPRPVAGVIGNLAANMDWELLERVVSSTPMLSWAFVGPTSGPAGSTKQHSCRSRLMSMNGRVRFAGAKPYGQLRDYARAFDVAVLPYRRTEPTCSGSSTRFYEQLAACRPIVATNAPAELLEKPPLLRLASDAYDMIAQLQDLQAEGFRDGYEALRWKTSFGETWEARASLMMAALAERIQARTWAGNRDCEANTQAVKLTGV
jgi:glycosyltransferase involved in cell wall biosynthesis